MIPYLDEAQLEIVGVACSGELACGHVHGPALASDDLLNLLIEVTGEKKKDKAAKVATARTLWVPAVNNHGGFGRWAFIVSSGDTLLISREFRGHLTYLGAGAGVNPSITL